MLLEGCACDKRIAFEPKLGLLVIRLVSNIEIAFSSKAIASSLCSQTCRVLDSTKALFLSLSNKFSVNN